MRNPVTEVKLLDALMFIAYTPQLFDDSPDIPLLKSLKMRRFGHEQFLEKLITILHGKSNKVILQVPLEYLEKYGIKELDELKNKYKYRERIQGFSTVYDLVIGLMESLINQKNSILITKIFNIIKVFKPTFQTVDENESNITDFKIGNRVFEILLNLICQKSDNGIIN